MGHVRFFCFDQVWWLSGRRGELKVIRLVVALDCTLPPSLQLIVVTGDRAPSHTFPTATSRLSKLLLELLLAILEENGRLVLHDCVSHRTLAELPLDLILKLEATCHEALDRP